MKKNIMMFLCSMFLFQAMPTISFAQPKDTADTWEYIKNNHKEWITYVGKQKAFSLWNEAKTAFSKITIDDTELKEGKVKVTLPSLPTGLVWNNYANGEHFGGTVGGTYSFDIEPNQEWILYIDCGDTGNTSGIGGQYIVKTYKDRTFIEQKNQLNEIPPIKTVDYATIFPEK